MKLVLLLLSVLLFVSADCQQIFQSNCVPTGDMQSVYKTDARRLALTRLYQVNAPYKDSIIIPQPVFDTIARALYAIENMAWSPIRDTIMNLFGFRDFDTAPYQHESDSSHINSSGNNFFPHNRIYLNGFGVMVQPNSPLHIAWSSGNYTNSPNATINQMVLRYGLIIVPVVAGGTQFIVGATSPLNTVVLAAQFTANPDVLIASTQNFTGDGNYIEATYDTDGIRLRYRNGCGDCPSGCTYETSWIFKVYYNTCQVAYISRTPLVDGETAFQRVCSRGTVMPIDFTRFKAAASGSAIHLEWKMAAEENIIHYIIERSANSSTFSSIGKIVSNSASMSQGYKWTDQQPLSPTNYYRIKAVGARGGGKYSPIVKVVSNGKPAFKVAPNPVIHGIVTLSGSNLSAGSYTIRLIHATGGIVFNKQLQWSAGSFTEYLPIPKSVAPGSYILQINSNTVQHQSVVVVQ